MTPPPMDKKKETIQKEKNKNKRKYWCRVANSRSFTAYSHGFTAAPRRIDFAKTNHATFLYTTTRLHPFSMQLPAVQEGQINARSCSPPTTTWILGAYPPSSKASARRRRCSSRDAARSCDQINCKKRVLPALFHKRCPSQPTFSPWVHTSDDSYIYQLSLVLATATVSFITSD